MIMIDNMQNIQETVQNMQEIGIEFMADADEYA